jgi:hypothetical protein
MSLEDKFSQHDAQVVDKYHAPNAAYAMSTRDYVLRPSADGVSGAIIITLPSVAEAKGRFYSIVARNADAVNTITITDDNDSECWLGDIVFDGKCDHVLLYSDGLCWHPLGAAGPGAWPGFGTTAAPGTSEPPTTAAPTTARSQTTAAPTTAAPTTAAPTTAG